MALVKCPECGGTVSSFAKSCPHCGRPMEADERASEPVSNGPVYEPIDTPSYNPRVRREPEITNYIKKVTKK